MKLPHLSAVAVAVAVAALAGLPPALAQQTGVNPDITALAMFIGCPAGADDCAYAEADSELEFQEFELALQGYLNPYVRGEVFASYHGGDFELEEAYASFVRGLGPFQARIGKYKVDWGTINPLHPHAYSWIFQPLVEERFFGEEGLNQVAANLNLSFPAGQRGELTFSANLLRGDIAGEGHAHAHEDGNGEGTDGGIICVGPGCDDGLCEPGDTDCALVYYKPPAEPEIESSPELAYHLRTSYFTEFKPNHSVIFGLNGLSGTLDPALDRKVTWLGGDFKYRWRPDKYRSLNVIGSYIQSRADLEGEVLTGALCIGPGCVADACPVGGVCKEIETYEHAKQGRLTTSGWYLLADWQFAQRWNGGLKYDWSEGIETTDSQKRAEAFVNFRLMEESTVFRLLLRREDGELFIEPRDSATLQLVFSLGPHKPHTF